MQDKSNPYQASSGGYSTNISFGGQQAPAASGPLISDTTTASFKADVMDASRERPVLVDFWAPWCGPCKQLAPLLEKVVTEARGAVKLVKMNIDEHPQIAGQLGVQSIPAVIAFVNGQPVDGFMGAVPESQIRQFIAKLSAGQPDPLADALAAAEESLAAGDPQSAMQIYSMILQQDPANAEAIIGAGGVLVDAGQLEDAEGLLAGLPADKAALPAVEGLNARIRLAREVAALGDPLALARRLADNPADHQARIDLAKIENAKGERDAAADHLLAVIKADRGWNDEAAKKQLIEFFQAWGMTDPATLAGRRKLSSLLFS
jgi:putative thioredoxin